MDKDLEALHSFVTRFAPDEFRDRVRKSYSAPAYARAEATRRLNLRLESWDGNDQTARTPERDDSTDPELESHRMIAADEAEKIILRALSNHRKDSQFTVTPEGTVYATHNFGWTKQKVRVFVAGLSPLLDEAARLFHRMSGGRGGRILFTPDDTFIEAKRKSAFLKVVD